MSTDVLLLMHKSCLLVQENIAVSNMYMIHTCPLGVRVVVVNGLLVVRVAITELETEEKDTIKKRN